MTLLVSAHQEAWMAHVDRERWQRLAHLALARHGMSLEFVDVGVTLVDRETMRAYHARYHGDPSDTDVMAFPLNLHDPETQRLYLGDVVICFPVAEHQARERHLETRLELCLLFIHGLLHLLGYDDTTPEGRKRMWQAQQQLLEQAGCPLPEDEDG